MPESTSPSFPLDLADRCVKCGLCLPHCPTYQITENEAESPRGRIALMQGLATELLAPSTQLEKHLDGCLSCRNCETVCPAQVPYGELIDQGRALLGSKPSLGKRLLNWLLTRPRLRRLSGYLLLFYQRAGLQALTHRSGLAGSGQIGRMSSFLPQIKSLQQPATTATPGERKGRVALFTGCVSEWLEADVLQDAVTLLNACGFDVDVPDKQNCCGALYQHNGQLAQSRKLAEQNIEAFSADYDAVMGTASGCTAMMKEYPLLTDSGQSLAAITQDISHFLHNHWLDSLKVARFEGSIAVHDPCTLKNVLRQADSPYLLLQRIPGAEIQPLDDNATCCGAAGDYFITQPDMADQLGEKKLAAIRLQQPEIIVTSNVGCGMQIKTRLREAGLDIPVLHPISLLRQQLMAKH